MSRVGSGRVGSKSFKIARVGSGRVGSGRVKRFSKSRWSGRVMTREIRVTRGSSHHDPRVFWGDPRVFWGDPRVFWGDLRVFWGDPRVFWGDPRVKPADLARGSAFFKLTAEGHRRAGAPRVRPADS